MITEIDQFGMLTISAETPLEAYALLKWCEGYEPFKNPQSLSDRAPDSSFVVATGVNAKGQRP